MCFKVLIVAVAPRSTIMQLQILIKSQEAELRRREKGEHEADAPAAGTIQQLSAVIAQRDQELEV